MAKLLIIDSNISNVKKIQRQFESINSAFSPNSTFCYVSFSENSQLGIAPVNEVMSDSIKTITEFCGKQDIVIELLDEFILKYPTQNVMIVINSSLISPDDLMTMSRYNQSSEFTCLIYHHLVKLINGYKYSLSSTNIGFLMYSPTSVALDTMSHLLENLYREEDEAYFPKEACELENISWCSSLLATEDTNILILPSEYKDYMAELN